MGGQDMLGGGFKMMGGFPTILLGLVFLAAEVVGSDNLTGENKQMKLPVSQVGFEVGAQKHFQNSFISMIYNKGCFTVKLCL